MKTRIILSLLLLAATAYGAATVNTLGNDNIFTGANTFTQPIVGNVTGSATTAGHADTATTATDLYAVHISGVQTVSGFKNFSGGIQSSDVIAKGPVLDIRAFGAKGDGVTDDTTAIQTALDTAAVTGADVFIPPSSHRYIVSSTLTVSGVRMYGVGSTTGAFGSVLQNNSTDDVMIKTTAGKKSRVEDLYLIGRITSEGLLQLNGTDTARRILGNFSKMWGIQTSTTSVACLVEDCVCINMVYDRTGVTKYGAFDIDGTDHFISRVEGNCSSGQSGSVSSNKVAVALYVKGSNCFVTDCIGEFGEIGILISGSRNRVADSRADRCMGDGWIVSGAENLIHNSHIIECGTAQSNTYIGMSVGGQGNIINGVQAALQGSSVLKYVFEDTYNGNTLQAKNVWLSPRSRHAFGTAKFNFPNAQGSVVSLAELKLRPEVNASVIDVSEVTMVDTTAYSAPTTITNFTNGVPGQEISVISFNGLLTFAHNSNIKMRGGGNLATSGDSVHKFKTFTGSIWYEE